MSQTRDHYEKYSESWSKLQEPMQDFVRLNTEAFKRFQAIKPEEFTKITRPDEFWSKSMELAVANGEKAIDYMQQSLQIMQKAMHVFAENCKTDIKK
jgi:acyl carrier protein phosphodiesterase